MDIERAKEILFSLADLTLDEIRGVSVHPAEYFDPVEIFKLVLGEERLNKILRVGIDEYKKRAEDPSLDRWNLGNFRINTETLEISEEGDLSFGTISNLIREQGHELDSSLVKEFLKIYNFCKA